MTEKNILICPKCKAPLTRMGGSLVCEAKHTYDIAKTGYVNLINTNSKKESGDSKEMSRARSAFLSSGAYAPFRDALCRAAGSGDVLIDAGCGEGYYTVALAGGYSRALGFDLSKASVDYAAKRARAEGISDRTFFGVGSVYDMPVASECADCITSIFAPCATDEFLRILKHGAKLVVACAGKRHLEGMKAVLYENVRENTDRADLPSCMHEIERHDITYDITLEGSESIRSLYMMTPYCHKTAPDAEARLFSLDKLKTVADFEIRVYEKD